MALSASVDICNMALAHLLEKPITATDLEKPGTNTLAYLLNIFYETARDIMLERLRPNWALNRIEYDIDNIQDTITAITAASPPVVTGTDISDAGILEGLGVLIWDCDEDDYHGKVFYAKNVDDTAQTLELYYPDGSTPYDGSSNSAATEGYIRLAPLLEEYSHMYLLPTALLSVIHVITEAYELDDDNELKSVIPQLTNFYSVEKGYLYIDSENPKIRYVEQITDVSKYDAFFNMCVSVYLASLVTNDAGKKARMEKKLEELIFPQAEYTNAVTKRPKTHKHNYLSRWRK